ncbi:MAG: hypothetical protein K0V04_15435 [Deltaproteobacteria bacterium]|nr:hypothetical protein [Deltaproteobacteria bacterium]
MPDDADALSERLADSTARYLGRVLDGQAQVLAVPDDEFDRLADIERLAASHRAGLVVVLEADRLATDQIDREHMESLGPWGFALQTHDVGRWTNRLGDDEPGSTVVLTAGADRLPRQYAAYELLRRLGVRFFHPEQEYVPVHAPEDLRALARRPTLLHRGSDDYRPDFDWRSWSFHSAHPLEHLEAFSDPNHPIDEAVHVNDWVVKNFGNRFRGAGRGAVPDDVRAQRVDELEDLRELLGFPRGAGLSLHNLQQGASAEIDPLSDVPVRDQIEGLVADKLQQVPDARWFGIHFGPTEFSVTPDEETVQWIDWAGRAALALRPDVTVEINNHITGSQPSPNFGDLGCPSGTNGDGLIDYYDLAFHTDPRLAVRVHTVMFYPLEGPARVYNQDGFGHKRCLMEQASAQGRPLQWFPEGSWWLSFDNTVPTYLPLYMWSRARDIELLKPLLASRGGGTLDGHRMFNSGHEWGYWQQDYAVGLMAWNADASLSAVMGEIFDPLCDPSQWREGCAARTEAIAVTEEVIEHQRMLFLERQDWQGRPGGLFAYFAGEDEADAIAAASGFEFRPVRVSFSEVASWDAEAMAHFRSTDLAALQEAATAYEGWTARLTALEAEVPQAGQPWLAEVLDGVQIDGLRAAQAASLYEAVLRYREVELSGEGSPTSAAHPHWLAALETLAQAQRVIQRRESAYRYPSAQTHGGGLTDATGVDNGTTYPYRVHTKTHLLTYWINRQAQVSQLLVGGSVDDINGLRLEEALDVPGAPLTVRWPELLELSGQVQIGTQSVEPNDDGVSLLDLGGEPGHWSVTGDLLSGGLPLMTEGAVIRSDVLATTPAKGMVLLEPQDPATEGVLSGVLPSLRWGWLDDPAALAMAPDPDGDGSVAYDVLTYAPVVEGDANGFRTAPIAFDLPVALGSGSQTLYISIAEAELSGRIEDETVVSPVTLDGQISVEDIVDAAIELAGFDEAGTLALLGDVWGFDPANPPAWVPLVVELTIE